MARLKRSQTVDDVTGDQTRHLAFGDVDGEAASPEAVAAAMTDHLGRATTPLTEELQRLEEQALAWLEHLKASARVKQNARTIVFRLRWLRARLHAGADPELVYMAMACGSDIEETVWRLRFGTPLRTGRKVRAKNVEASRRAVRVRVESGAERRAALLDDVLRLRRGHPKLSIRQLATRLLPTHGGSQQTREHQIRALSKRITAALAAAADIRAAAAAAKKLRT